MFKSEVSNFSNISCSSMANFKWINMTAIIPVEMFGHVDFA